MRIRPRRAVLSLVLALAATPAWSWGPSGHRIVAMIAEQRLSPEARVRVSRLLFEGQYTLSEISNCADALRAAERSKPLKPEEEFCLKLVAAVEKDSAPWHYIDIKIPTNEKSLDSFCPAGNCITAKIAAFRETLRSSSDDTERRAALLYLTHLLGDIHQPLHCAERACDRGGNLEHVNFYLKKEERANVTLHHVWDGGLIGKLLADANLTEERFYATFLLNGINEKDAGRWRQSSIEDVAWESYELAKDRAYRDIPFHDHCADTAPVTLPATNLSSGYEREGASTVREQLRKAGVRLAEIIEKNLTR
jgi:hypothetical protein